MGCPGGVWDVSDGNDDEDADDCDYDSYVDGDPVSSATQENILVVILRRIS